MTDIANPTFVAARVNMRRIRDREAAIVAREAALRGRRRDARRNGYSGPLTRAELARKVV